MSEDRPHVLAPPPVLLGVALLAGYGLHALLGHDRVAPPAARAIGAVLVLAGGALAASFLLAFVRARTSIDFKRATTLITTGVYSHSRNPGYVGMALLFSGIAIGTGTWWALPAIALTLVVVDRRVVVPEERYLEREFGDAYRAYRGRTRRWV